MVSLYTCLLLLLISLTACHASNEDFMTLTKPSSFVNQLQDASMRWRAWGANSKNEWVEWKEIRVSGAKGVREASVTFGASSGSASSPRLSSLRCEESRRVANGFRRGWCILQSAPLRDELTFDYRVAVRDRSGGSHSSAPLLRDEAVHDEDQTVVGRVTHAVEEEEEESGVILLRFDAGEVDWLPAALRLAGVSSGEAAQMSRQSKMASTLIERWGYPVAAAAILYGGLCFVAKLANRLQEAKTKVEQ